MDKKTKLEKQIEMITFMLMGVVFLPWFLIIIFMIISYFWHL